MTRKDICANVLDIWKNIAVCVGVNITIANLKVPNMAKMIVFLKTHQMQLSSNGKEQEIACKFIHTEKYVKHKLMVST